MVNLRDREAQLEELDNEHGQIAADSAGQSGDTQGLSPIAGEAEESVEELAQAGQDFEAGVLQGVEEASDHPERPVRTREDQPRSVEAGPERDPA